ncbi:Protein SFK1 [Yarrowia sp. C11]|nr:Protein SFK1 [Yarrowia sp. E02]KAG5372444.1 Protein SFK1 [Yarrowia sp. C11]
MYRFFWIVPLLACVVWWGMLIALLTAWAVQGKPIYDFMDPDDKVAYISDVGATSLKPVFVACAATQGGLFMAALIFERWMRHKGRLLRNHQQAEKWLSVGAIIFGIFGQVGIILVSIFDTKNHHSVHVGCLVLFIVGIGISAILNSAEYTLLDKNYPDVRRLRTSYILRWIWVAIAIVLAIIFAVCNNRDKPNVAAGFEWSLSFFYGFYLLILAFDLIPFKRYAERNAMGNSPPMTEYGYMQPNDPAYSPTVGGATMVPPHHQQDKPFDEASYATASDGMAAPHYNVAKPEPSAMYH